MPDIGQLAGQDAIDLASVATANGAAKVDLSNVPDAELQARAQEVGIVVNAVNQTDTNVGPSGAAVWALWASLAARVSALGG